MDCIDKKYSARSDRDGRNGHNQNENPHGLQNHYHKVPILFKRHYKIFCVNAKYGIQYGFRIFYLIALQNEENYEREESCSA